MTIDYLAESKKYQPTIIKTLLIGEAPPPSGKKYFYVPMQLSNAKPIEKDTTLPATIFNHYFRKRPTTVDEYRDFLLRLKDMSIFLIDICDEPIRVRGCPDGVQRVKEEIPKLRSKMSKRNIQVADENIIFLLARTDYTGEVRNAFPDAQHIRWKEFRISTAAEQASRAPLPNIGSLQPHLVERRVNIQVNIHMKSSEELVGEILKRFRERGFSQVGVYNRFGYIRETPNSVIVSRERGEDTPISFSKITTAIDAVRSDHGVYTRGPSALRRFGITHISSPIWSLLHLLSLNEILE